MNKKINASIRKCSSCGDDLIFNPDLDCLFCVSCKSKTEIKSNHNLNKHELNKCNDKETANNKDWAKDLKTMQCPNCGAQAILHNHDISTFCSYCNTTLIANKHDDILQPDSIIPFRFGKQKSEELFKEILSKKWFAPKGFKNNIKSDEINAYYFPAFLFDADCTTNYIGQLYENIERKHKDGSTSTIKKYFTVKGTEISEHQNVEIEASSYLSQYELNSIKPYNFSEAKQFTNEYVYGYKLENNSTSIKDANSQAHIVIKKDIKTAILNKYTHDGVESFEMQTSFSNEKYNYCVLPIYRINYSYKNNNYSNIMNGQTGKLTGNYPKSGAKITIAVFMVLLVVFLPILLIILSAIGIL